MICNIAEITICELLCKCSILLYCIEKKIQEWVWALTDHSVVVFDGEWTGTIFYGGKRDILKQVSFKMETVLTFSAIQTLFWIAAESLYTRGKIHFVKKKNIRKLEKKSQKTRTLHRKLYYCLRSSLQKVGLRLNLFKLINFRQLILCDQRFSDHS